MEIDMSGGEVDMMSWATPKLEAWLATRVEGWVRADPDPPGPESPNSDYDEDRTWRGHMTDADRGAGRRTPVPRYSEDDAAWSRIAEAVADRGLTAKFEEAKEELLALDKALPEGKLRVMAAVHCWPTH